MTPMILDDDLIRQVAALREMRVVDATRTVAGIIDDLAAVAADERIGDDTARRLVVRALRAVRPRAPLPADRHAALADLRQALDEGPRPPGRPGKGKGPARTVRAHPDVWAGVDGYATDHGLSEADATAELLRLALTHQSGGRSVPVAYEIVNVQLHDARYRDLFDQLHDPALAGQMWADAEHRPREDPATVWTFAVVDGAIAAWAAATPVDGVLKCSDHYERRGPGRDHGLFRSVLDHRERTVVAPSGLRAVAYVFEPAATMLEAYGWRRTGLHDVSRQPGLDLHPWWELVRVPGSRPRQDQGGTHPHGACGGAGSSHG